MASSRDDQQEPAPPIIPEARRREFAELFADFSATYFPSPAGQKHLADYETSRRTGERNFRQVVVAADRGEDVTDAVLSRLLPHTDSANHRESGDWVHIAPAITKDIRTWYDRAGLTTPGQWPAKAALILEFVRRVVDEPGELEDACRKFGASPLSKGLQSGMLTPILNALLPDRFAIMNSKAVKALNRFAGGRFTTALSDYPRANAALRAVAEDLVPAVATSELASLEPVRVFDMFAHWLVAIHRDDDVSGSEIEDDRAGSEDRLDRQSSREAREVIESFFPDQAQRALALEYLVRTIRLVHSANRRIWSVTLHSDRVRLNVGWVFVLDLSVEGIDVLVLPDRSDESALSDLEEQRVDVSFKSLKSARQYGFYIEDAERLLSVLQQPHERLIAHLAARARGAPFRAAHSPGVLKYLREAGYDVPDPVSADRPDALPGAELEDEHVAPEPAPTPRPSRPYGIDLLARDTSIPEETLRAWIRAIQRKGQAIFFGPPGTGKTYVAEHIARHLVGEGDGEVELVQFHPAYAYEDFIQGLRPIVREGQLAFHMVPGRFVEFCKRAAQHVGTSVLLIDEINRANLSQVFGELMFLLEYRDRSVPLAGGGELRIPEQVRIIGTMNTADRSIALVDHALRRRFAFLRLDPDYAVLQRFHASRETDVSALVSVLRQLNAAIGNSHYAVGVSFFLRSDLHDDLGSIWLSEIEPYLEEYFFDNPAAVEQFRWSAIRNRLLPSAT